MSVASKGQLYLGIPSLFLGGFSGCLTRIEPLLALYDPQLHGHLAHVFGQEPGVVALSLATYACWFLGYPRLALQRGEAAVTLARELDHPFSLLFAMAFAARLHRWRRDIPSVQELAEALLTLWAEHGMALAEAEGTMHRAWAQFEYGQHSEGIARFNLGLAAWQASGMANHLPEFLAVLAEMWGKAGQPERGLSVLDDALATMEKSDERYYEAELYRIRGELLLAQDPGSAPVAETSFHQAIDVARGQSAKMCELRATASLCQLWLAQKGTSKRREAHEMLDAVYSWFSEGFDTPDLQDAQALLDTLR